MSSCDKALTPSHLIRAFNLTSRDCGELSDWDIGLDSCFTVRRSGPIRSDQGSHLHIQHLTSAEERLFPLRRAGCISTNHRATGMMRKAVMLVRRRMG